MNKFEEVSSDDHQMSLARGTGAGPGGLGAGRNVHFTLLVQALNVNASYCAPGTDKKFQDLTAFKMLQLSL